MGIPHPDFFFLKKELISLSLFPLLRSSLSLFHALLSPSLSHRLSPSHCLSLTIPIFPSLYLSLYLSISLSSFVSLSLSLAFLRPSVTPPHQTSTSSMRWPGELWCWGVCRIIFGVLWSCTGMINWKSWSYKVFFSTSLMKHGHVRIRHGRVLP